MFRAAASTSMLRPGSGLVSAAAAGLFGPTTQLQLKVTINCQQVRHATKKSGGSSKNGRTSLPKYLGFKSPHQTVVKPGTIILRQRGTEWHAGTQVGMGRDHTLFALGAGRVVLHYDLARQRRIVSVDDGTLGERASKPEMKKRVAERLDLDKYLGLSAVERLSYVQEVVQEVAREERAREASEKAARAAQGGLRKFDLVDLTLL
ncbi:ribosomal L27 protein-domain-containing protein [Phlyctochytrium arcticum]|nr:ribosomal L27 protein-domain-containing protein [Phlyctochytrium arcticum]